MGREEEKEFSQISGGMGMAHFMTENEFIERLRGIGYTNAEINEMIEVINLMKNKGENMPYEELLPFAIDAYYKFKDFPDDLLPLVWMSMERKWQILQ